MGTTLPLTMYAPPGHVADTREDAHVHTALCNDATQTLEDISVWAEHLDWICLTTHIRHDTPETHVSSWAEDTRALWLTLSNTAALISVETKLLTPDGDLDAPVGLLSLLRDTGRLDTIHIADHQHPTPAGPLTPETVRKQLEARTVRVEELLKWLTDAYVGAMYRYPGSILAHPCSITDKTGISDAFTDRQLNAIVEVARETQCAVEVNNKWNSPTARMYRAAREAGAALVNATDSHHGNDHVRRDHLNALARGFTSSQDSL